MIVDATTVGALEALGVWAAVLVALFGESARRWFIRPKLAIRLTPERQSFHRTRARPDDPDEAYVPVFYYRLEVENTGGTAARDVEVFARAVFREKSTGTWVKDERFVPQWLEWATLKNIDQRLGLF